MRRIVPAMVAVLVLLFAGASLAQARRMVTVRELFELNHQLEVDAGTEVIWIDPHFERVWFPSNTGPTVKRTEAGLVVVFDTPGTYRGRFTVVAGHATTDVYPITVVVRGGAR